MKDLLTTGDIERAIGVPRPRVDYAIEKAGIRERCRAGILRMFGRDQVPVIRAALDQVRSKAPRSSAVGVEQ